MNQISANKLAQLGSIFAKSLRINYKLFGQHSFRKFSQMEQNRSVLNASLWDVLSTAFIPYFDHDIDARHDQIFTAVRDLFQESEFNSAITISTNDTKKVTYRFTRMHTLMTEIFA